MHGHDGRGATIARDAAAPPMRFFVVGADPADPQTAGYLTPGAGRLTLRAVTLTGGRAQGGGANGGGGGAGMGGAIFSQGIVIVERSTLTGNTAIGGSPVLGGLASGANGGGMGSDATPEAAGGFGPGSFGGGSGGAGGGSAGANRGGGGAGLRTGQNGFSGSSINGILVSAGGGPRTGLGGDGADDDGTDFGPSGDGAGGGGRTSLGSVSGHGGAFGAGGTTGDGPGPQIGPGGFTATGSTFAANTAAYDGASIYNLVYDGVTARTAQTVLRDTIVSGGEGPVDLSSSKPVATAGPAVNLGDAEASVGAFNLVRTLAARAPGTVTGTPLSGDPLLGPLRDNGGLTATMAPAAGSPVIDAGSAFGMATDQRDRARPSNFVAIPNAADGSDIGAVELQAPAPISSPPGPAPAAGGGGGGGVLPPSASLGRFGSKTLVTLSLAASKIPANGPLKVRVSNTNTFSVSGRLSGSTTIKRRRSTLKAKSFTVAARGRKTVTLVLPKAVRTVLAARGRVTIRLAAAVRDAAGASRTVTKSVTPKLQRRKR